MIGGSRLAEILQPSILELLSIKINLTPQINGLVLLHEKPLKKTQTQESGEARI